VGPCGRRRWWSRPVGGLVGGALLVAAVLGGWTAGAAAQEATGPAVWSQGNGDCGFGQNGSSFLSDFRINTEAVTDGDNLSVAFVGVRGPLFATVSGHVHDDSTFALRGRNAGGDYAYEGRIGTDNVEGTFTLHTESHATPGTTCTATWNVRFPISGSGLPTPTGDGSSTVTTDDGGGLDTRRREPLEPEEGPGDDDDFDQQDTLIEETRDKVEDTPPPAKDSEKRSKDELAELEIKKEQAAAMEPVELGRSLVKYTIMVTNKGPAAAQNVVVADYMVRTTSPVDPDLERSRHVVDPLGVKVAKDATSDNSEGSCQMTKDDKGHFVSGKCKLPLLAKGAQWTITYQVEPTLAGYIVNGAAAKCDNLKRGWRKEFTLWMVKRDFAQDYWASWRFFKGKDDGFEWAVDAATTDLKVVEPSKKP